MTTHAEAPVSSRAVGAPARVARAATRRVGPWTLGECRTLAAVHVIALAVIVLSYWKSSGQAHPADQLTWLNLSVVAMLIAVGADAVFFARGHRMAARVRRTLFTVAPTVADVASEDLVALDGGRRFHLAGCAFVTGKTAAGATRSEHEASGRVPCEVCLPGGES